MKRWKDGEKITEPMFPRLHVNDTEKGGPRAPPRNKMALYEQLSIPSERSNWGPLNTNSHDTATVESAPAPSRQGNGQERRMSFPHQQHSLMNPAEKSYDGYSDSNATLAKLDQQKNEEEDFTVPIFVQTERGHGHSKSSNSVDRRKLSPFSTAYSGFSMKVQNINPKEPKRTNIAGSDSEQLIKNQNEENPKEFLAVEEQSAKNVKSSLAREKTQGSLKQTSASADSNHKDSLVNYTNRLRSTGAGFHHVSKARSQVHNSICGDEFITKPVRGTENGYSPNPCRESCQEELGSLYNHAVDSGHQEDQIFASITDGCDDASETSMVDSVSCLDISPDDVVGVIGQKHFWRARRAIANQQRVFAVQVFELHRLIKVQRFIAGSPHILFDESAYLGKPLKSSSPKKLPLDYSVRPSPPHLLKHKNDFENPNRKMECSGENAVGKTSFQPFQDVSQPPNFRPVSRNPHLSPVVADNTMSPWGFHPPSGHQWLIPVMSPSEGLIYKPYQGHGFSPSAFGGCGLPGSNSMMGNFVNPAYCVHPNEGTGIPPPSPPVGHGYFPPYGMPVINQANSGYAELGSRGHFLVGAANFNLLNQSSCNVSTPRSGANANVVKPSGNESCLQGSTASSPRERAWGIDVGHAAKGRNSLPPFPAAPTVQVQREEVSQLHSHGPRTRVIKVVPHNVRSATESAARIFRAIQKERKQHDSV